MAVAPAQPEATRPQLTPEETRRLALEWGLSESEYDSILERLGRVPTVTEIAMFSVEWCEHCGYPKSRKLLALFPKESRRLRCSSARTPAASTSRTSWPW
jgi:phosphoribosylformylglycinamidine (FGAM) synthase-like enzyme